MKWNKEIENNENEENRKHRKWINIMAANNERNINNEIWKINKEKWNEIIENIEKYRNKMKENNEEMKYQ